ncbi:MAG: SpoIIE family protein phosphatase [Myxococcota bacterium]
MTPAAWVEVGVAGRPLPGQAESGDASFVCDEGDTVLLAVIDGLGHGSDAAVASRTGVGILAQYPGDPIDQLFQRVHQALGRTRGAVMTIARLERHARRLTWAAVGNVVGHLSRVDGTRERVLESGGIVGHSLPRVRVAPVALRGGELLVLATDGVRHDFRDLRAHASPQDTADALLARAAVPTDDALVLIGSIRLEGV